jgi:hypothetical protein
MSATHKNRERKTSETHLENWKVPLFSIVDHGNEQCPMRSLRYCGGAYGADDRLPLLLLRAELTYHLQVACSPQASLRRAPMST